jgi:hypothetical protein
MVSGMCSMPSIVLKHAKKRAASYGGSSDNREASNRVDRSHSVSTEWTINVMIEKP